MVDTSVMAILSLLHCTVQCSYWIAVGNPRRTRLQRMTAPALPGRCGYRSRWPERAQRYPARARTDLGAVDVTAAASALAATTGPDGSGARAGGPLDPFTGGLAPGPSETSCNRPSPPARGNARTREHSGGRGVLALSGHREASTWPGPPLGDGRLDEPPE
ncbi:hypothetical protein GCM10027570_31510 [Streptomonospora sediminis]